MKHRTIILCLSILVIGCNQKLPNMFVKLGPEAPPAESYERPPEIPFDPKSYIIKPEHMASFYDVPGEAGYFTFGTDYGFDSMSFVITETHPQGGPPLHTHANEEAHVLLSGSMDYIISGEKFTAIAPYIARVPANAPHTFINSGATPLNLIGVFSSNNPGYEQIGPNPLVEQ